MNRSTSEPLSVTGVSERAQLAPWRAAVLQLLPGIANLIVYLPLAALFAALKLPAIMALGFSLLIAEVPLSWAIMVRRVKVETGSTFRLADAFPWRTRIPVWQYLVVGLPAVALSVALVGIATFGLGAGLRSALFAWLPSWYYVSPDPSAFSALSSGPKVVLAVMSLLVFAGVGGITQELYSRGFLLPRMAHLGAGAPALNALLFGVFHLGFPWNWPGFFLLALPWAYLVWWKRSIKIGLFAHVGMLLIQSVGMILLLLGIAPAGAS